MRLAKNCACAKNCECLVAKIDLDVYLMKGDFNKKVKCEQFSHINVDGDRIRIERRQGFLFKNGTVRNFKNAI